MPPGRADSERRRYRSIRRALLAAMAVDLMIAFGKGLYGHLSGSLAMASDGLHSALHASGSAVSIVGISLAARPPDPGHPYGYERYEPLATIGVAGFMFVALWRILEGAWNRLHAREVVRVDAGSFLVMGTALIASLLLASWERARGRRLASVILRADASRTRSDVLVSCSVIGGLVAARLGFPGVDTLVSVVVAAMIGLSTWGILRSASRDLTDAAVRDVGEIASVARSVQGVVDCHQVRARGGEGTVRVDLHVTVDPEMTVASGHAIAKEVQRRVQEQIAGVAEVLVHVGGATLGATLHDSQQ